jgi:hypothetical protein
VEETNQKIDRYSKENRNRFEATKKLVKKNEDA